MPDECRERAGLPVTEAIPPQEVPLAQAVMRSWLRFRSRSTIRMARYGLAVAEEEAAAQKC